MSAKSHNLVESVTNSLQTASGVGTRLLRSWTKELVVLVGLVAMVMPASAQDAGAAEQALCDSGIGEIIGVLLVLLVVGLGILSAFRAGIGLNNMGSSRSEKVQQGRSQVRGAGLALAGALAPAAIAFLLETFGIPTVSCIDLGSIVGQVAPLL